MRTVEELKGMTQDELVVYAQELQENLTTESNERKKYFRWWTDERDKHEKFTGMMRNMLDLVK